MNATAAEHPSDMGLKNDMTGAALLADWLGDGGKPVPEMEAYFRAQRCIIGNDGHPCPHNCEPGWYDRVKHVIADWIKAELALKHDMHMALTCDDDLAMCRACGCCLKLAVWVPKEHYQKHKLKIPTDDLPDFCWKKKELSL